MLHSKDGVDHQGSEGKRRANESTSTAKDATESNAKIMRWPGDFDGAHSVKGKP